MEKNTVRAIMSTMENVSVHGHENWERLLACWQALNKELEEGKSNEQHQDEQGE